MKTYWSGNDTVVVVYNARFGFHSVIALQLSHTGLKQAKLARDIWGVTEKVSDGEGFVHVQLDGSAARMFVNFTTNPKGFEDMETKCGVFSGVYDIGDWKWVSMDARAISEEDSRVVENTLDGWSDAKVADGEIEEQLSNVYRMLHVLLPKNRFSELEERQVEWMKGALEDPGKNKLRIEARVKELTCLLWASAGMK